MRDAIHDAVPLRQCTDRLSLRRAVRAACLLAGIGRCGAPCESADALADYTRPRRRRPLELGRRRRPARRTAAPADERAVRRRTASSRPRPCATAWRRWSAPAPACSASARSPPSRELVAARPDGDGGWELSVDRATGGWPPPGSRRAASPRCRSSMPCWPPPRRWPPARAAAGRAGRRDRGDPALARRAAAPGSSPTSEPVASAGPRRRRGSAASSPPTRPAAPAIPFADRRRLPMLTRPAALSRRPALR